MVEPDRTASEAASEIPDLSVIVPTRNERSTVRPLTERVSDHLAAVGLSWEIVFIDDSEDDTPSQVASLVDEGFPVRLYHRPRSQRVGGLAGAIAVGLAHGRADVLAVMDADLQHPPEVLESLARPLLAGQADIAGGSRYIPGGDAAGLESQWRQLVSKGSRRLTHVLFAETRLSSDPGSGLFALRQSVIDGILLQPEGFKMLTEILIRGRWATLHETPYRFSGRMYGASNATVIQGFRFLRHLRRLWIDTRLRNRDLLKSPGDLSALGPMIDEGDALAARPAPGSTSS